MSQGHKKSVEKEIIELMKAGIADRQKCVRAGVMLVHAGEHLEHMTSRECADYLLTMAEHVAAESMTPDAICEALEVPKPVVHRKFDVLVEVDGSEEWVIDIHADDYEQAAICAIDATLADTGADSVIYREHNEFILNRSAMAWQQVEAA